MKYKISDLARLMNVSTNTIRRYENMGYFSSDRDPSNSYRMYDEESVFQALNARLLRKYGFSHEELAAMNTFSMEENITAYQEKMKELEDTISNLKNIHHRIKDDIKLMQKATNSVAQPYFKDCVDLYYSLYSEGSKLAKDAKHQEILNNFIYDYPEVQRIYLMKKKDIDNKSYTLCSGWAVKGYLAEKVNLTTNEFVHYYPTTKSIMCMEKISTDELNEGDGCLIFHKLSQNIMQIMKDTNSTLNGDIIGVAVSKCFEDGKEMLYILISAPVSSK